MYNLTIVWLVITILMSTYVCFRWGTGSWLNIGIKMGYGFIAMFGCIFFYHVFIMGNTI